MEKNLQGVDAQDGEKILQVVKDSLADLKVQTLMLDPKDFAIPITQAAQEATASI